VQLLQQCKALSLYDQVTSLFSKILGAAIRGHEDVFERTLLPYLALLLAHLRKESSLLILGCDCCGHFHVILQAYIIRGVRPEPRRPLDFRIPTNSIQCNCKDCLDLKAFIADNGRSKCQFQMLVTRRQHLEKQIYSNDFGYHSQICAAAHTCGKESSRRLFGKARAMAAPVQSCQESY
jgi:hypothetical protein